MNGAVPMPPGLFVVGTDTDIGKTYVTALLARAVRASGRRPGVYKPACSGAAVFHGEAVWGDVEALRDAAAADDEDPPPRNMICPQCFTAPLAPPVAAAREGRAVDDALLTAGAAAWAGRCDVLLIEGAGGLLCPLSDTRSVADVAAELGFPLLIVARAGLGTVGHTLLILEVAAARGLPVAGVLLNEVDGREPEADTNARLIERHGSARVLGVVRSGGGLPDGMDWRTLTGT